MAVQAYWAEGVGGVSLNEICRRADVSKPGLYREFGNEDGLMKAALIQYREQVLAPLLQILESDVPFHDTLAKLTSLITADCANQTVPAGCLWVKMRNSRARTGAATQAEIDDTLQQILTTYENWVERSKARGEFPLSIPTSFAAVYIDAQLDSAMSQRARGEKDETINQILEMAFSVFA